LRVRSIAIRVATVRTQLKHVFAKTGVTRQTELAVLLASLGNPAASPARD